MGGPRFAEPLPRRAPAAPPHPRPPDQTATTSADAVDGYPAYVRALEASPAPVRAEMRPRPLAVEDLLPPTVRPGRANRVSSLLAQVRDTPDADNARVALAIAEDRALVVYRAAVAAIPAVIEREPRSRPAGVLPRAVVRAGGQVLPLDAGRWLSLASLDRLAPAPFATVVASELTAAVELVDLELAVRRAEVLTGAVATQLADIEAEPARYPLQAVEALQLHAHDVERRCAHLLAALAPANRDQQPRLAAALASAQAVRNQARAAVRVARRFHDATEPTGALQHVGDIVGDWQPGEAFDRAADADRRAGGITGHVGAWSTDGFHAVVNALTAGHMDRQAANTRAYREGRISWNAYRHRDLTNYLISAVEAIVSGATAGWGGRGAAWGLERLGITTLSARITHAATVGLGAGALAGGATPAAGDAVTLLASYTSDDPYIHAYQRSLIGGPEAWATGALLGGGLGAAGGAAGAYLYRPLPRAMSVPPADFELRYALASPDPVLETLPPPIADRLQPVVDALARRRVLEAIRLLDEVAVRDRLPPALVTRIENELAAQQGVTSPTAYRTSRVIGPDGQPLAPTAWTARRYYGIDVPDDVAHQMMLDGLPARGPNLKLLEHTLGANDSAFRGSTISPGTPDGQQGAVAWAGEGGWVFEVDGVPSWDVEQLLQGRVRRIDGSYGGVLMPGEIEHALLAEVPTERIVSIRKVVSISGRLRGGDPVPNPNYRPGKR